MSDISKKDLLKISYLYYKEGKTQAEISDLLGLNRFKVGRLLKKARESGLVTIQINDQMADLTEMEVELAKVFGLQQAIIVQVNEHSDKSPQDQVGEAGAHYLANVVSRYKYLGVAWGRSVYHLVNNVPMLKVKGLTVAQISGGFSGVGGTDNNTLTMMLAHKLSARVYLLHAPVIVSDKTVRESLLKEKNIGETLKAARKVDLAILGIGMVGKKGLLRDEGFLDGVSEEKLKEQGAVGAICGRIFNIKGEKCFLELDDRIIGLDLDEIRRIKHKICIARGSLKLDGILGAMRGKLLDVLITDSDTATQLLSKA